MWKDGAIHSVGVSGSSSGCGGDGADGGGGGGGEGGGEGDGDGCIVGCGSCRGNGGNHVCGDGGGGGGDGARFFDDDLLILQYKMDKAVCEATKEETFYNIILYTHKTHHHCRCAI